MRDVSIQVIAKQVNVTMYIIENRDNWEILRNDTRVKRSDVPQHILILILIPAKQNVLHLTIFLWRYPSSSISIFQGDNFQNLHFKFKFVINDTLLPTLCSGLIDNFPMKFIATLCSLTHYYVFYLWIIRRTRSAAISWTFNT